MRSNFFLMKFNLHYHKSHPFFLYSVIHDLWWLLIKSQGVQPSPYLIPEHVHIQKETPHHIAVSFRFCSP